MFDKFKNWILKRKIPKNITRFRYASDGITKIPVNDDDEIKNYNYARNREKALKKKFGL